MGETRWRRELETSTIGGQHVKDAPTTSMGENIGRSLQKEERKGKKWTARRHYETSMVRGGEGYSGESKHR